LCCGSICTQPCFTFDIWPNIPLNYSWTCIYI